MPPLCPPPAVSAVLLARSVREALVGAAARAWPHEACGLLVGRARAGGVVVTRAVAARNRASRPAQRYEVAPQDWCAADAAAAHGGERIVGVWHSHPHGPAVPSAADVAAAWPEYVYVIAGLAAGRRAELRAWQRRGGACVELPIAGAA